MGFEPADICSVASATTTSQDAKIDALEAEMRSMPAVVSPVDQGTISDKDSITNSPWTPEENIRQSFQPLRT